jgi:cysteine synthase
MVFEEMHVFVGAEVCCLAVASFSSYKNIQDSHTLNQRKINKTTDQQYAWQQHNNPYNLEQSRHLCKRKTEEHYSKAADSFITTTYTPCCIWRYYIH